MIIKKSVLTIAIMAFVTLSFFQCNPKEEPSKNGKIVFKFEHLIDNQAIIYDTTIYVNEAGNHYQINRIQYFLTDVSLKNSNGTIIQIDDWTDYKYVDNDIPTSLKWEVFDPIPEGNYSEISFTFGWSDAKNQSMMFVNPPEVNMMWPEFLGGGYHYLKLDGKWIDSANYLSGCAWHLGRGQQLDAFGNIIGFIDNSFRVTLPSSSFSITENLSKEIQIVMNIENWFKNPNTFNFDNFGGDIMQNQTAMNLGCENGHDVFTIGYIK